MSEYIIWESDKTETTDYLGVKHGVSHFEKREEIVRCRDCKHYRSHEFILITDVSDVCMFWAEGVKVEPDGFCAWGERRTNDN